MPKNKGRGGKNYRRGKNENETKRELIFKEPEQEYAQVTKMLGNGRLETYCFDGKTRLGHIRGKLKKKVWIMTGDIVLVGVRDFQDNRCDVIYKYTPDEVRALKSYQEIPENIKINENDPNANQGTDIVFEDDDDENDMENDNVAENPIKQPTNRGKPVESSDSDEDSDDNKEERKKEELNIDDI